MLVQLSESNFTAAVEELFADHARCWGVEIDAAPSALQRAHESHVELPSSIRLQLSELRELRPQPSTHARQVHDVRKPRLCHVPRVTRLPS
jgi:hypothetical protein